MPYADPERRKTFARQLQQQRQEFVVRAKSKPCLDCHIQYASWVMQFDHRDPSTKKFSLARPLTRNFNKLQEEIDKCDVVCANCHATRTYNRRKQYAV